MSTLSELFENNRRWAARLAKEAPDFLKQLSTIQNPEYLWIGCSDSRVPANQITGLAPGEVFVHRNVANIVVHSDMNCLAVLQFAVEILKVRHVMVVGHYGCGGVRAAMERQHLGLVDNWLAHVVDVEKRHAAALTDLDHDTKWNRLCELNVIEQVMNVARTSIVRDAWIRDQPLNLHGWIYSLQDGLLRDLGATLTGSKDRDPVYEAAIRRLLSDWQHG